MIPAYLEHETDPERLVEMGRQLERLDREKALNIRLGKIKLFVYGLAVGTLSTLFIAVTAGLNFTS